MNLFMVFLLFIDFILLFAALYDWLYKRNSRHFAFNAEILNAQKKAIERENYSRSSFSA